jgi:hypothetical protein
MPSPDRDLVDRVIDTFQTAEDADYFFDQLKSPEWIEPLASADLFKYPPEPIRVEGGFQFPPWSASRYLARMAGIDPSAVRSVLLDLPETENIRVLHDVADAVLAMPPEGAVEFVPRMVRWLDSPFQLLLPSKLGALLRRLSLAGLVEPALGLAAALFRIRPSETFRTSDEGDSFDFPTEAVSTMDRYDFESLIDQCRFDFIEGAGLRGLVFLCDLLASAMGMEASDSEGEKKDFSWIWRPSIAPHEQNQHPSVRSSIVSATFDAAIQLASGEIKLDEIISTLESREWTVLRRISLAVLRECAPKRSAAVAKRLADSKLIFDPVLHHEFWMLLHDRFRNLTPKQQKAVMDTIRQAPPIFRDSDGPYGDTIETAAQYWQADLLAAIAGDVSGAWREWFDELHVNGRVGEHPDFQSYSTGGFVGTASPISDADLASMPENDQIEFLRTWVPEPGWGKPSPEGLGRAIAASVRSAPNSFAEQALAFRNVDPTYVNAYLSAFREVAVSRESFPWEPILQLSQWVVRQDREIPGRVSEYGSLDSGWVWTRSTIAHLLELGFDGGAAEMPIELRVLAWSVLEPLTGDAQPSIEEEARYGGSNMDASTYAINTVRGQAIKATMKYALWVHHHLAESDEDKAAGFDLMPEVREVLNHHIDPQDDPSYAVHSMYGEWFPWLQLIDRAWVKGNLPMIFPPADEAFLYWEVAWDSYISYCPPYDSTFDLIKEEYERAVNRIDIASPDRKHPMLGLDRLGQHLMIFYLRGRVQLDDPLIKTFHKIAPINLRASALRFVGRRFYAVDGDFVHPYPDIFPETTDRARGLWAKRYGVATAASDAAEFREEIAEFGWWFLSPNFDEEWALTQLQNALRFAGYVEFGHMVVRRLAVLADARTVPVLDALQLLIGGDHQGFLSLAWDSVWGILQSVLRSSEIEVRRRAESLVHELGARGYRQFRELLNGD